MRPGKFGDIDMEYLDENGKVQDSLQFKYLTLKNEASGDYGI